MHVLWTCNANVILWELVLRMASGEPPPTAAQVASIIWESHADARPLLELGTTAESLMQRLIERYAHARTGLNLLLYRLDDGGAPWTSPPPIGFSSQSGQDASASVAAFLAHVHCNRQVIDSVDAAEWLRSHTRELFDDKEELRLLAGCKYGYTKNLFEFARYSLGQVEARATQPDQRSYDLGYLIAYAGRGKDQPVQAGPAMLVMLVHACCAASPSIPMSLDEFRRHLGDYGLHVPAGELVDGRTGRDLAMLGLVVDSPDAAGGRLLVRPF
jgi:hypothetical protein